MPTSGGATQCFHRVAGPLKPPATHRDGVGGPVLAATAATVGKRARRRLVGAPEMMARSPVKFMDVCDVKVIDEDGFLAGNMMIKAKNTLLKERTGHWRHCLGFYQRDVTDGMRSPWNLLLWWSPRVSRGWSQLRRNLRTQCSLFLRSVSIEVSSRTLTTQRCGWCC